MPLVAEEVVPHDLYLQLVSVVNASFPHPSHRQTSLIDDSMSCNAGNITGPLVSVPVS